MESDLEMVIKNRATVLSAADVKAYMRMLLQGLQACHAGWILHRDVKPNNFLISSTGGLKPLQRHTIVVFRSLCRMLIAVGR